VCVKKTTTSFKFLSELKQQASVNLKYKTVAKKTLKYKTETRTRKKKGQNIDQVEVVWKKSKKQWKTKAYIYDPNGGKTTLSNHHIDSKQENDL